MIRPYAKRLRDLIRNRILAHRFFGLPPWIWNRIQEADAMFDATRPEGWPTRQETRDKFRRWTPC